MIFQYRDWPVSFLESEYAFFLKDSLKEHAEPILQHLLAAMAEFNPHFPNNVTRGLIQATYREKIAPLNLPLETRKEIPLLIEDFVNFLSQSGLYPPAVEWVDGFREEGQKYANNFREDGSFRGETQRRSEIKIGRNAPCPCGSGKKFKNCCGK